LHVGCKSNRRNGFPGIPGSIGITGKVRAVLLPYHTDNGKHADTSVFKFGPASVVEVGLDIRKAHGVKSHISLRLGEKARLYYLWVTQKTFDERLTGSDPSSFSGTVRKGMERDISLRATDDRPWIAVETDSVQCNDEMC
jgi:hypothetical protein